MINKTEKAKAESQVLQILESSDTDYKIIVHIMFKRISINTMPEHFIR